MPNPTDATYSASYTYSAMETCIDQYKSEWLSLVDNNRNHALPGYNVDGSAKVSDYWRCIVNVYRTGKSASDADTAAANATEKANLANEKAGLADEAARLANEKAAKAEQAATNSLNATQEAEKVDAELEGNTLKVTNRNGSTKTLNVKGEKGDKGEGLDWSTMSQAEKDEVTDAVAEQIAQEGGYAIVPVNESMIGPTATYEKNSILCLDGVIYKANKQTQNLPFPMVVEDGKILTVVLYGKTVLVRASNTKSADWDVWIDASNDIRFKTLEERVARLETIINSL